MCVGGGGGQHPFCFVVVGDFFFFFSNRGRSGVKNTDFEEINPVFLSSKLETHCIRS